MNTCIPIFLWLVIILAVPYAFIVGANWMLPVTIEYTWRSIEGVWWLVACGVLLHAAAHKNARIQQEKGDDHANK